MNRILPVVVGCMLITPTFGAINVHLTVQESLYPGSMAGLSRTGDPVSVGVPLPDDPTSGATDVSQLTLSGATAGQFRVLGRWPSGRIKWVLVDSVVNVGAGATNGSLALTDGGSGNFGGPSLAVDNGATITVSTGAATFTIRKANFNVVDQVQVGGVTVVASGASQGLVVNGPAPGQTTCPPCATVYSSANDASSTAVIEENGPVKTVIKATGRHVDSAGNAYMNFTVRLYFYKGKTSVKVTSILRNADYGSSNTFASAFKGHQGYELRIAPNLGAGATYSIATDSSPVTGSLAASDSVYLYQADSKLMRGADWCGYGCVPFTQDTGFSVVKNGSTLKSGSDTQYPQGWADVTDASGAGVEIGVYQMAAYSPKSLEFNNGGADTRIGIWARQNSQPYYQAWPNWSIHDLYLNFHAAPLASPSSDFLKYQHALVGRADRTYYNSVGVFPYNIIDPSEEDSYYKSVAQTATPALDTAYTCCLQDKGLVDTYKNPLVAYRFYAWGNGGGGNQMEFHLSYLYNFISRGYTGRYLDAAHFYRFVAEKGFPHSDGFDWRSRPASETDGWGFPLATSTNGTLSFRNFVDQEHAHWYGMPDFYFMSGDETVKEAILEGPKDRYLNPNASLNRGVLWNSRAIGGQLMSTARLSTFLRAIGDPDADAALQQGISSYNLQVKPDMCMSGYPEGCSAGSLDSPGPGTTGVSRTRGAPYGYKGFGYACSSTTEIRINASFQSSILLEGIWELRQTAGPSWADYNNSLDLAYGISSWALSEMFADDGSGNFTTNGFRYYESLDSPNACETYFPPLANQTVWFPFLIQNAYRGGTDWKSKFNLALAKTAAATAVDEFGLYTIAAVIDRVNRPGSMTLVDVPVNVVNNGGGSYTLNWTVPANAVSYRIKTGQKRIVNWIGFDPTLNQFVGDPATTMNWFAATDVPGAPVPTAAGGNQSVTVTGYVTAGQYFAVKAYVGGAGATAPAPARVTISVSSPSAGATLTGPVTLTASASSAAGISTVTFAVDGVTIGSTTATGTGSYTLSWDTTKTANGSHTLVATATDVAGTINTATVAITVSNAAVVAPAISGVGASGVTANSATITWSTDKQADTQVAYGSTSSYGSLSALATSLVTAHSVTVTSLTASTTYHYEVMSRDSAGNLSSSADLTFTTAAAAAAPSATGALPTGSWTMIKTQGPPVQTVGWEKVVYSPALKGVIMLGDYHELSSEPNRAVNTYNFETNRWDVLDIGESFHTEYMPEAGHPSGLFVYDSNQNAVLYYCCSSGSMQPENVNHTWWFDPVGQVGRDKFTSTKPSIPLEATAGFDPVNNRFIFHGSAMGTWSYDPAKNVWQKLSPAHIVESGAGTFPASFDSIAMASMTYNPADHKLYLFGGRYGYGAGQTFSNDIFTYDVSTNTWTMLAVAGTKPPARQKTGFAYDSLNNIFLVFGGNNDSGLATPPPPMNDTWVYAPSSHSWTQASPAQSPASGGFETLAYDPDHNVFIMTTSGSGGYTDGSTGGYPLQTWLFRYNGPGPDPGKTLVSFSPSSGGLNRNSDGWAMTPVLASSGANLYAGWIETGKPWDGTSSTWSHVQVSQQNGALWSPMGATNVAVNSDLNGYSEAFSPSLTYSGGTLWVSYYESNNSGEIPKIYAKQWGGSSWSGAPIGTVGASVYQGPSQLADVGGKPNIAFLEVDKTVLPQATGIFVKEWNGSAWVVKGGALNRASSGSTAASPAITSDGSNPYVAWSEYVTADGAYMNQTNPKIYVSRWTGSQWAAVGGALNMDPSAGWALDVAITYFNGKPYVAWTERSQSGNTALYVKAFDGTNWVSIGTGSLNTSGAAGWAYKPALIADSNNLYVGWTEQGGLGQRPQAYVSKLSSGAWAPLGGSLNVNPAAGAAQRIGLAIVGGQVAATWGEVNFGSMRQVFVKQWNGSAWTSPTSTTVVPAGLCDLNGDGKIDVLDVQVAVRQVLGLAACSNADLMQNGQCNVVDIQRIVVASTGSACITGK